MSSYHLQEYFYYTRLERNAAMTLLVLCITFFILPVFYPLLLSPKPTYDFTEIKAAAVALSAREMAVGDKPAFEYQRREAQAQARAIELFHFDPNVLEKEDWLRLGIAPRTAQTILNYRSKGGKFFKKEDLLKVYGFREEDYERLEGYVQINMDKPAYTDRSGDEGQTVASNPMEHKNGTEHERYSHVPKEAPPAFIDINSATPAEWQQLRGIGPAFSKRIVNFREKLGGFATVEQVGETYGFPDSTFQKILPFLQPSPVFRKINLNTATLDELKNHPYISPLQATILFNYRQQHGAFQSLDAVKKAGVGFKESDWKRLEPYLALE
ncbi:MAG: helix-hairpin-helix domain-containing protein [Saprospiraceae bacterium]